MSNDTISRQPLPTRGQVTLLVEGAMEATAWQPEASVPSHRGRPQRLSSQHLGWAVVWCLLMGSPVQLEIWRTIALGFQHFAPLLLSNQAIYKRLHQSGMQAVGDVVRQVSGWLARTLPSFPQEQLASFASDILIVDESTLDAVGRWLSGLREVPVGDPDLLAGRLSGLFDLRQQQWRRVDLLPAALVDSKVHVEALMSGLRAGTLLLFDLGYFSFEWFDTLTRRGHFWISRLRRRTSYEIRHVLVSRDGYSEALIWLGAYRADRAAFTVRLIQVRHRGQWYRYLTNVLDPCRLSGAEVVQLYARRWDIELAFRALKDHLGLSLLWSARWEVIGCQILASVLLANVFHVAQRQLAHEAGVEVFDVSLALLVRYIPRLLHQGQNPLAVLRAQGRDLGVIRPSTRRPIEVPPIGWREICWPPDGFELERPARYAHNPGGHARKARKNSKKAI